MSSRRTLAALTATLLIAACGTGTTNTDHEREPDTKTRRHTNTPANEPDINEPANEPDIKTGTQDRTELQQDWNADALPTCDHQRTQTAHTTTREPDTPHHTPSDPTRHRGHGCKMPIRQTVQTSNGTFDLSAGEPSAGTTPLRPVCTGTGTDGSRVHIVYLWADTNNLAAQTRTIHETIQEADRLFWLSSSKTGPTRQIRWRTDHGNPGCWPTITPVQVSETTLNGTATTANELFDALSQADVWAPDPDSVPTHRQTVVALYDRELDWLCGYAPHYDDDTKNGENVRPEWLLVQLGKNCWNGVALAHELAHAMGAVNSSAPNATGAGHCNDGTDIMCYQDNGPKNRQRVRCQTTGYRPSGLLDCNNNDYLHTNPPRGSYLATRWNIANSPMLQPGPPIPGRWPTMVRNTPTNTVTAYPYQPVPFTVTATHTAPLGTTGPDQETNSCHVAGMKTTPRTNTTTRTTGWVSCGDIDTPVGRYPTTIEVFTADMYGRDTKTTIPIRVVRTPRTLQANVTTTIVHRKNNTVVGTVTVTGKTPAGKTIPLMGVDIAVYMNETPLNSSPTTDHNGTIIFTGQIPAGQQLEVVTWPLPNTWDIPDVTFTAT